MRTWALSGPAVVVPQGALAQVSVDAAEVLGKRHQLVDTTERTSTSTSTSTTTLGEALSRARDLANAYCDTPTSGARHALQHALGNLDRFAATTEVNYEEILAIKELRRMIHGLARHPEHADVVWSGCIVSRFAEPLRDEPLATRVGKEYARPVGVRWKDYSDKYFGPLEARATYDMLRRAGVIPPPGAPLRFVSAAANSASQEAAMFERDRETSPDRKGGCQFIVGDLAEIATRALPGPTYGGTFLHVRWNASQLPLAPGSVDVLWDRKGCLWFALMNDHLNQNQRIGRSPLLALAVLRHYEEVLKPGGSLVLDAIPKGLLPEVERSTSDAIETVTLASTIDVLHLLKTRFDVRYVGEGVTRCLVLTKRSA